MEGFARSVARLLLRLGSSLVTITLFAQLSFSQPAGKAKGKTASKTIGNTIKVSVHKGPKVEISPDDVRAILREVSRLLRSEYVASHPPSQTALNMPVFELLSSLQKVPSIPRLDPNFLSRVKYPDSAVKAIRKSEKDGAYGEDAVQALLSENKHVSYFQLNIVRQIVAYECPEQVVVAADQQLATREDHAAGCSAKFTNTSVIELQFQREPFGPAYDEWVKREAVLWAHEICHLLGLHDLRKSLRPLLPPTRPGIARYLMMGPYNPSAYQLLPMEGDVIAAYPNNDSQANVFDQYLKDLTAGGSKVGPSK